MRGRRVTLLLTGLWPLLAKDDVPATDTNVTIDEAAEHDIYDDALQQLPKLPLPLARTPTNPGNIVMADPVFDILQDLVYIEESDRIQVDHMETNVMRDSQTAEDTEEETETSSQDESDTTSSDANNSAEVDATAEDASESPALDDVEAAQESESSNVTTTDEPEEAESVDSQDGEAVSVEPAMDEDEEVTTDRVLVDYASKSAGALILEKSPAMKGTSNLLNADNDKYAIAPCSEKKFVVIGLSEDILVKQVKLANYERYSSHLKDFQIMGSQTMGDWVDLGTYTAEPGNGEQAFDLKEPAWARYLKFRFLSHHGSEHYCTYSQIKVHGSTMLQGFHEQWDSQEDLEEDDDGSEDAVVEAESADGVETTVEESNESDDSTEKKEGETLPEAENNVSEEQDVGDEVSDKADGSPSEIATETDFAKSVDAVNEDTSGGASSGDSADDHQGTDEAGPDVTSKETEETPSTDEDSPSNTDIDDETIAESELDRRSTNVSDNQASSSALSCASIGVYSHDAMNAECTGSTKELDTSAIKLSDKDLRTVVTTVVKNLVAAEAIMTVMDAESVSDEVKEIQEKLKMSGTGVPKMGGDTGERRETVSADEAEEPIPDGQPDSASTVSTEPAIEAEDTASNESEVAESEDSSVEKTLENGADVKSSEGSPAVKDGADESGDDQTKTRNVEPVETSEKSSQLDLDPALANVVARFPSAACMNGLDYQTFKAKIVAARKDRANAQGGNPSGHTGKMEPIFKTLTDEIKGLHISQSAQDQYMKALVSCYQQVMLEMAETLSDVERGQEKRLLDLEEAMVAMRSSNFKRVLAVVITVLSTCYLGVRLLFNAIVASRETFVALGLIDTTSSLLVFGVCSLGFLAIFYYFYAARCKEFQQRRRNEVTEKTTETKAEASKVLDQTAVIDEAPSKNIKLPAAPDIEQSENGSETSDPVISLLPRKTRPDVQTEPAVVPLE